MSFVQLPDRLVARVAAFSLVGVVNGVFGIGIIVIAGLLGAGAVIANVLGYGAGLVLSFILNSRLTFQSRMSDRSTVFRFLCAFAVAFVVDIVVVKAVVDIHALPKLLGSLTGTPLYVAVFYLLCEYWVFRRPTDEQKSGTPPH